MDRRVEQAYSNRGPSNIRYECITEEIGPMHLNIYSYIRTSVCCNRFDMSLPLPKITPIQINQALQSLNMKHIGTLAQGVASMVDRSGKLLECFKCGDT